MIYDNIRRNKLPIVKVYHSMHKVIETTERMHYHSGTLTFIYSYSTSDAFLCTLSVQ